MAEAIDLNLGRHAVALAEQEWGPLKPLGEAFRALIDERPRVCLVEGNWYVVSIEYRQWELANGEISKCGAIPFFPIIPTRERHGRGGERTRRRPMFGQYGFVRCEAKADNWGKIKAARGVQRLLGGDDHPLSIEEGEIEVIRLVQANFELDERDREDQAVAEAKAKAGGKSGIVWYFSEGDRVRIKNGPFAGFYAKLQGAVDDRDRIKALTTVFGRESATELSAFDIEAA